MIHEKDKYKSIASKSVVVLALSPLIGTLISGILLVFSSSSEDTQYGLLILQLILMGIYNIPFLAVSIISILLGNKTKYASLASIICSIIGVFVMISWGLGLL